MTVLAHSEPDEIRRPRQVLQQGIGGVSGEAVILDLSSGVYFGLNSVGARVWELLQGGRDLRSIRAALLEEFDVPASRCEADLLGLVRRMAEDGLVHVA